MTKVKIYKDLVSYLGGPTKAAQKLGVKQGTASGWKRGDHGMSSHVAVRAEQITSGKFKASDLNENLKPIDCPPA